MTNFNQPLPYHKFGHGPKVLLAFHGIGQDGQSCFAPFEKNLGHIYTIYAFDLFFHGQNVDNESFIHNEFVTKQDWKNCLDAFLAQHQITRFDIAGFSMGGRFALATLELYAPQIQKVILMAPDGITENPLYSFASRFPPARVIFRTLMQHPKPFLKTVDGLKNVGLIHRSLHRFTLAMLDTPEKRKRVFNSWTAFRNLRFDISSLYQTAQKHHITIFLFAGEYDNLLKPTALTPLARLLGDRYILLPTGHTQLVEKSSLILVQLLG